MPRIEMEVRLCQRCGLWQYWNSNLDGLTVTIEMQQAKRRQIVEAVLAGQWPFRRIELVLGVTFVPENPKVIAREIVNGTPVAELNLHLAHPHMLDRSAPRAKGRYVRI